MSKGLEAITSPVSTELKNGKQYYTYTKEDVDTIEKELKALEIIRKKNVSVGLLINSKSCEDYNYKLYFAITQHYLDLGSFNLTQEEWDLLKEILL